MRRISELTKGPEFNEPEYDPPERVDYTELLTALS
jgi:hypothetical protein